MDSSYGDTVDDFVVPKDQSQYRFPVQERWKQWGKRVATSFDTHVKNCATHEADFSCVSLMDDVEMDQADVYYVDAQGGLSEESSLYWNTLLNNQDYQPSGHPGTNQTDDIFMNSLLVDDVRGDEQFHFYGSPKSQLHGSFSIGNNLTSNMMLESSSDFYKMQAVSSYEHLNQEDFQYSFDWEKMQSDTPHYNISDTMTNATLLYRTHIGHQPSIEETVLQEFGSAMQKMTHESRLCFRDALYRLASSSEKNSINQCQHGDDLPSLNPFTTVLPVETSRSTESEAYESRTNTIDRTVADFMFHKAYPNNNSPQELVSTTKLGSEKPFKNSLAPHFQYFTVPAPEDAVVPTLGQGEAQYSEY